MTAKARLRYLFKEIAECEEEIRCLNLEIEALVPSYMRDEGLLVRPRKERIRDVVTSL